MSPTLHGMHGICYPALLDRGVDGKYVLVMTSQPDHHQMGHVRWLVARAWRYCS